MDKTQRFHDTVDSRSLALMGTPVLQDMPVEGGPTGATQKREREAFVPVWKQSVTDEQGRKRFHGAFTGGFSAGYFNTVGSKEGWTPSTFVSSRDARAEAKQTVDDFMDDEDRDVGVATTVEAKAGFALFSDPTATSRASAVQSVEAAMTSMLQPAPDTMGLAMMRQMGWSDGHGIGPLRRLRVVKKEDADATASSSSAAREKRVAGPALSRDEIEELRNAPIAPRDVGVPRYQKKEDPRGLGYDPHALQPLASAAAASQKRPSKAAFGIGALEEADNDIDDPFDEDDKTRYDVVESRDAASSNRRAVGADVHQSQQRCSDGRPPLPGFSLARTHGLQIAPAVQGFAPVTVPRGWKPSGAPQQQQSALGTNPAPAVLQWAIAAAQRGLALMAAKAAATPAVRVKMEPPAAADRSKAAIARPLPFQGDPAKQQRYQAWLLAESSGAQGRTASFVPSVDELVEFVRARSEWSAVPARMADSVAPAGAPTMDEAAAAAAAVKEEFRKYGPGTTRSEVDWAPEPLLCRRWGVKDPFADSSRPRPNAKAAERGGEAFPSLTRELEKQFGAAYRAQMEAAAAQAEEAAAQRRAAGAEAAQLAAEAPRPGRDVFSAIFDTPILTMDETPPPPPPPPPPAAPFPAKSFHEPSAQHGPASTADLTASSRSSSSGTSSSSVGPPRPTSLLARPSSGDPFFRSIFGDAPPADTAAERDSKRSRTDAMLQDSVVLREWVETEKEKKERKKQKKADKKKHKKHKHKKSKK